MNRKIRLALEDLKVESFEMAPQSDGRQGTVHGYATEQEPTGCVNTCALLCDTGFCVTIHYTACWGGQCEIGNP